MLIWEDILDAFEKEKNIDFAYPTMRFYNNKTEGKESNSVINEKENNKRYSKEYTTPKEKPVKSYERDFGKGTMEEENMDEYIIQYNDSIDEE